MYFKSRRISNHEFFTEKITDGEVGSAKVTVLILKDPHLEVFL